MATERGLKPWRIESVTARGMRMLKRSSSIDFHRLNSTYVEPDHGTPLSLLRYKPLKHLLYILKQRKYLV